MTPLFRNAIVAIENMFDPLAIVIGGIAPPDVIDRLVAAAQPLPHSVAERRDRSIPRVIRSANGEDAVLRGAAALAVSGVLSPRIGLTFAANDPLMERGRRRMTDTAPLLQLDNIVKNYGAIEALKGISFDIDRGQVVALLATTAPASPRW